ncbi:hypothetical protein HMPREF3038_01269 [Akkermansia sp. KLE1797]|nr:hypothetical protein HMPREF3038_01269 [Akkermansia sp. KLE1797]
MPCLQARHAFVSVFFRSLSHARHGIGRSFSRKPQKFGEK